MSSDINVQTFSGKVNITSNLLVGSSHLFVDTINNRVGLVTNTPDAGLHVNSNAYVHTNFRVGSGIVMNDTTGRITAGSFVGDGSAMTGINSDSGSWVNGTDVVYLSTIGDKVGIGTTSPATPFHISSTNEITTSPAGSSVSQMRYGSTNSTVLFGVSSTAGHISAYDTSSFSTNRNLCFNADGGNVGIGVTDPISIFHTHGGELWDGSSMASKVCATLSVARGGGAGGSASTQDAGTGAILKFTHDGSLYRHVTM